jgi:endonuclease G, mitochondrial
MKKIQKQPRDVVEVEATLAHREPDDNDASGGRHVRLRVTVVKILVNDADVSRDLKDARSTGRAIFVAIRSGDAMGIQEKMKGLNVGSALHLRGECITREKARAHGGDRMSVLPLHPSSAWVYLHRSQMLRLRGKYA